MPTPRVQDLTSIGVGERLLPSTPSARKPRKNVPVRPYPFLGFVHVFRYVHEREFPVLRQLLQFDVGRQIAVLGEDGLPLRQKKIEEQHSGIGMGRPIGDRRAVEVTSTETPSQDLISQ